MPTRQGSGQPHDSNEPVYMIGVAARLVDCHPQTLRMYERLGLVEPQRTGKNMRLYSADDIEKLRQIQRLTQDLGVNLAGVQVILDLLERIAAMRTEMSEEIVRVQRESEAELFELRTRIVETGYIVQLEPNGGEPEE